jgi:hypothetical protein
MDHIDVVQAVDVNAHGSLFFCINTPRPGEVQGSAPLVGADIILGIESVAGGIVVEISPDDMDVPN